MPFFLTSLGKRNIFYYNTRKFLEKLCIFTRWIKNIRRQTQICSRNHNTILQYLSLVWENLLERETFSWVRTCNSAKKKYTDKSYMLGNWFQSCSSRKWKPLENTSFWWKSLTFLRKPRENRSLFVWRRFWGFRLNQFLD